MKRFIYVLVFGLAALALNACNTIEGVGRDLEGAGGAISDTATQTKKKM